MEFFSDDFARLMLGFFFGTWTQKRGLQLLGDTRYPEGLLP